FFFSSRRRHTRSKRDWSSDVCSSDLNGDIINDGMKLSYNEFASIFNNSPHPETVFFNIGNHEYFSSFATDAGIKRAQDKFKTFKIGRASCREREKHTEEAIVGKSKNK